MKLRSVTMLQIQSFSTVYAKLYAKQLENWKSMELCHWASHPWCVVLDKMIVTPAECFQISLSLDKNLMGYLKSEDTQLYIMNEVLSTCLGTLSFHFANNVTNASNTTSSSSAHSRKRPMTQGILTFLQLSGLCFLEYSTCCAFVCSLTY